MCEYQGWKKEHEECACTLVRQGRRRLSDGEGWVRGLCGAWKDTEKSETTNRDRVKKTAELKTATVMPSVASCLRFRATFCTWFSIQTANVPTLNHSNAACTFPKSHLVGVRRVSAELKHRHSQASCAILRMKVCSFEEGKHYKHCSFLQHIKLCCSSCRGGRTCGCLPMPWKSVTFRSYLFTQGVVRHASLATCRDN